MDASNMLKPALARGELQCIGATTAKEYRKYFERDAALERRFQPIQVDEPSDEDTRRILEGLKPKYEQFHGVSYGPEVIDLVVRYARRYILGRFLPDKAIDIMDEAGAMKRLEDSDKPREFAEFEAVLERFKGEKEHAIRLQNFELAAELRDQIQIVTTKYDAFKRSWMQNHRGTYKTVGTADICAVIETMTGIPAQELSEGETKRLLHMEAELHKTLIGQDEAVRAIASAIRRSRAGVSSVKRPTGSFVFLGPTGVGKTLLAKSLAAFLFGSDDALIRIDMSDFMERHNLSRLTGAPPGYVGYEEGGLLTEKVRRKPYSVVLFDEIEKAHPEVFNMLLQLLEEGELADSLGHKVSFRNTVIIMTSNAGARELSSDSRLGFSSIEGGMLPYDELKKSAVGEFKKLMNPELLNRIDDIVVFGTLTKSDVGEIVNLRLDELASRLAEKGITLHVRPAARAYLADHGYESSMGARPMNRLIQREIEDPLANRLLELGSRGGEGGEEVIVTVDAKDDALSVTLRKARTTRALAVT
jgi:ATP-dependent Clp protease ATP-binding subunit ClpC